MLARIASGATVGLDAVLITVEVDVAARGLPNLTIVGLPDKAVQESKERVRAALNNSGSELPSKRMTINLAPADLPKEGPAYDLPIAIGLLTASEAIMADVGNAVFIGELSLDGTVRSTRGVLPITMMAKEAGFECIYLPKDNAREAAIVESITVYGVESIQALVGHLTKTTLLEPTPTVAIQELLTQATAEIDMGDIHGQEFAKRALEIAAAGGHNVSLLGVPGAGKTMMARAFAGILPYLTVSEALEITKIYSISGNLSGDESVVTSRPFRSPHHTTSKVGLIGGGSNPKPGEISLAHRGVLFLDEFPEFPRTVIESLRQPLEDGVVHIARAAQTTTFPCRFSLITAANPCPCGNFGSPTKACTCSMQQIKQYQKKVSGPMNDRIDLHVPVSAVEVEKLTRVENNAEKSSIVQKRVQKARQRQLLRFVGTKLTCNAEMNTKQVKQLCELGEAERMFLTQATRKLDLTARSYFKTIKVARTIADLQGDDVIGVVHLAEALQYRHKRDSI